MTELESRLRVLWRALPMESEARSTVFICELPLVEEGLDPFVLYRAPKGPTKFPTVPVWRFGLIERRLHCSGRLRDFWKRIAGACRQEDDARREAERLALASLSAHQRAALARALAACSDQR